MPIQLQFRFKALRDYDDNDPSRIEPIVQGLSCVARFRIFDDRRSDARFVTLVVELADDRPATLTALREALLSLADVEGLTVDQAGRTHGLRDVQAAQLPQIALSDGL